MPQSPYPRRAFGDPAPLEPRPMSGSCAVISQIMLPNDANPMGNVHGGAIMKLVDTGTAVAAMRHCRRQVVTVALDHMNFHEPVYIGDLVTITSRVEYVGRTSMLVRAKVEAENPTSGRRVTTSSCIVTFVALGDDGRPVPVPPLRADNDEERAALASAKHLYERVKAEREQLQASNL